jgi:hypothetical protein
VPADLKVSLERPQPHYGRLVEQTLFDGLVETDYGQLDLVWSDEGSFDGDWERSFAGHTNGLVGSANPDGVYVNLSSRFGGCRVCVVLQESQPPTPPILWEDVVEVSIAIPEGSQARWESWGAESSGDLVGLRPGSYRLRVSAHGRDAARADEHSESRPDNYLVEIWPATAAPDAIVRVGSEDASYWHQEVGSRR